MSTAAEKLQTELAKLSETERAALAHFLIESLHGEGQMDAEHAWDAELEARGRQIRSGQAEGEPAEKVFAELRAKFS